MPDFAAPVGNTGALPGAGAPQANPLQMLSGVAGLQSQMMQNRLMQQQWEANQAMGAIFANSANPEEAIDHISKSPWAPFAGTAINAYRGAALTQLQMQEKQQQLMASGAAGFYKGLPVGANSPEDLADWGKRFLATQPDTVQRQLKPIIADYIHSKTAGLDPNPEIAKNQYRQRIYADAVALGAMSPDQSKLLYGENSNMDIGGHIIPGKTSPAAYGGGFTAAQAPIGKTPAPQVIPGGGPEGQNLLLGGAAGTPGVVPGAGVPGLGGGAPANSSPNPLLFGQTAEGKRFAEKQGDKASDYYEGLTDTNTSLRGMQNIIEEAKDLLPQIQTGGFETLRAQAANLAKGAGASPAVVDAIMANKNLPGQTNKLPAAQQFQKLMTDLTTARVTASLKGNKVALGEWTQFLKTNPGLETDKDAIEKIFDFYSNVRKMVRDEQNEYTDFVYKQHNDPVLWPNEWQNRLDNRNYFTKKKEQPAGGAKSGAAVSGSAAPPSLDQFVKP